jgi:hypothetical protein
MDSLADRISQSPDLTPEVFRKSFDQTWFRVYYVQPGSIANGAKKGPERLGEIIGFCQSKPQAEFLGKKYGAFARVEEQRGLSQTTNGKWVAVFAGSRFLDLIAGEETPVAYCKYQAQADQLGMNFWPTTWYYKPADFAKLRERE